jgi:D-aminopeptidase
MSAIDNAGPNLPRPRPMRARDLGILIGSGMPGAFNAITDVPGVRVGHATLISGEGPLVVGSGPVRTGVTVVVPCDDVHQARVFAGCHRLNGNGELTGLEWVRESGLLTSPIALTNTHSVGVVRDALVEAEVRRRPAGEAFWSLPVVGETSDSTLNDMNGFHVRSEHVFSALAAAEGGPVPEGTVGGGTGMICHGFKGGIGTASRIVDELVGGYVVGVLVQANHGRRERLSVAGVPVGRQIPVSEVPSPEPSTEGERRHGGEGSIIVVVATNAPLLPHQCNRLAQRAGLGVARGGGVGENTSGDLFISFATGNVGPIWKSRPEPDVGPLTSALVMLPDRLVTPLLDAVVDATEEAIVNALVAAETTTGRDGVTAHALPHDRLVQVMAG